MSYFSPDVIAREQLEGAASSPTVGGDSARYYYMLPSPEKKPRELLVNVRRLLIALKGE